MSRLSLSNDERGILVFKLWPNLGYRPRMQISFALIILGFVIQWFTGLAFPGVLVLLAGNALLLVTGYHNKVEFGSYNPAAQWQKTTLEKLDELVELEKKIKKWDRSKIDISNPLGLGIFVMLLFLFYLWISNSHGSNQIIAIDAAALFLPHWLTGFRRMLRLPGLMVKAESIKDLLGSQASGPDKYKLELLTLLKGGEEKLPEDLKIKIMPNAPVDNFLGLYGQVVINAVQGKSYPYFYVVLVAEKSSELKSLYRHYTPPSGIISEFKSQDKVDVFIVRQKTSKTSGYHTKPERIQRIFGEGLDLMEHLGSG